MIFGAEMVERILAGDKTVTRRLLPRHPVTGKPSDLFACRYEVGKTYAVQPVIEEGPGKGRGGKAVARVRIRSVLRIPLCHQLTILECAREGFGGFRAFRDYWEHLHGTWDPALVVDRIEFELVRVGA